MTADQLEEAAILGNQITPEPAPAPAPTPAPTDPPADTANAQAAADDIFDPNAPIQLNFGAGEPAKETIAIAPEIEQTVLKKFTKYEAGSLDELEARISSKAKEEAKAAYEAKIAQLEEAARNANPFANDAQKKLFDFVKDYDGTNIDGVAEFKHLHSLNLDTMPNKKLLFEAFMLNNKKMERSEAETIFGYEYEDKYDTSKLDPDIDKALIEKRKLYEKYDAQSAKEKIAKAQSDFKPTVAAPKTEQVPQMVSEAVKKNVTAIQEFNNQLSKISQIKVQTGPKPEHFFNASIPKEVVTQISEALGDWASSTANYDKDGNLYGPKTPQEMADMVMYGMLGQSLVAAAYERGRADHERTLALQNKVQKAGVPITGGTAVASDNLTDEQKEEMAIISKKKL